MEIGRSATSSCSPAVRQNEPCWPGPLALQSFPRVESVSRAAGAVRGTEIGRQLCGSEAVPPAGHFGSSNDSIISTTANPSRSENSRSVGVPRNGRNLVEAGHCSRGPNRPRSAVSGPTRCGVTLLVSVAPKAVVSRHPMLSFVDAHSTADCPSCHRWPPD